MSAVPIASRAPGAAGLAILPFLVLWLLDGFWKAKLVELAPLAFWAVDVFEWVVVPAATLLLLRHFATSLTARDCGLVGGMGAPATFAALFLCTLTLFLAYWYGSRVLGPNLFGYSESAFRMDLALAALGQYSAMGSFYLSATAGFCESVFALALPWAWFSRGQSVSRREAAAFAVLACAVFALGHWETGWANATGAFLFQLLAVTWYLGLKNIWPIIGAHFLVDLYWLWPLMKTV